MSERTPEEKAEFAEKMRAAKEAAKLAREQVVPGDNDAPGDEPDMNDEKIFDEPVDVAIDEARMSAVLGMLTPGGGSDLREKFPGMHLVKCAKKGQTTDENDKGYYLGHGYEVLSEDPLICGDDRQCIMGIPEAYYKAYEDKIREDTNSWKYQTSKVGNSVVGLQRGKNAKSLDELSEWVKA